MSGTSSRPPAKNARRARSGSSATPWVILLIVVGVQVGVFLLGYNLPELSMVALYGVCILFSAARGGYSHGLVSAGTATTLFIYRTVAQQEPAEFWLYHGVDVVFMLALGATVGRLVDDLRDIQAQRHVDELTGLFNRPHLYQELRSQIDRAVRFYHPLSVLFLDVDHFKEFNHRHGHQKGDALLKQIAHVLRSRTRGADVVCRFGGEEFALVLPETPLEGAGIVGERLRTEIANTLQYAPGIGERVTVSIGGAQLNEENREETHLLAAADRALLQAKAEGRDRVVLAPPGNLDALWVKTLRAEVVPEEPQKGDATEQSG